MKYRTELAGRSPASTRNETVSVAMTTYNGERFLREQIDSILAQTLLPREIVVADDCSSDGTRNILLEYDRANPGVFKLLFNERNLGFAKNFERAVAACSSDYVALCDQDDVWDPEKLATLLGNVGDADLVHSDARLVDSTGKLIAESYTALSRKHVNKRSFVDVCVNNSVTGCTAMATRALMTRALPFSANMPHDHWLAVWAACGRGIRYVPLPLVSYRQHEGNVIGAHGASRKQRKGAGKRAERATIFDDRAKRYRELLAGGTGIFPRKNVREIARLVNYYESYRRYRLRPRAFAFHIRHVFAFSYRKGLVRATANLFGSLFGMGEGRA